MPTRLHHVKAAAKDHFINGKLVVKKGQPYYWWKFRNRDKQLSLTKPDRDKLRKYGPTEFESNIKEYEERKDEAQYNQDEMDQLIADVEEYKDELESRLNNIPDAMQESSVLNEYIEQLDTLLEELRNMEVEDNY